VKKFSYPFELEGGGIEVSGDGLLLTTEAVQNNPNRAEGRDDAAFHAAIREGLAIDDILWIGEGLANDDTDGHIDNLARFIAPRTILAVSETHQASAQLRAHAGEPAPPARGDASPRPAPRHPRACRRQSPSALAGRDLPPSHANFLIVNDAVLVPLYGQDSDKVAMGVIGDCCSRPQGRRHRLPRAAHRRRSAALPQPAARPPSRGWEPRGGRWARGTNGGHEGRKAERLGSTRENAGLNGEAG
jgi:agmatine deiminase